MPGWPGRCCSSAGPYVAPWLETGKTTRLGLVPFRAMLPTAAPGRPTVLVVEDEEDILDVLEYNLEREGFVVACARDGDEGLRSARRHPPALVLLDLMLPGMDGVAVCQALRDTPSTRRVPIIMITAKDDESDVVLGLGVGADDYVTKPFRPKEVVARVKAVLRRGHGGDDGDARVERNGIVLDRGRHEVLVDGLPIALTRTEIQLLHVLAANPGRVFTRDHLLRRVMGDDQFITDRTIDVHIRRIRQKLGVRACELETVRGVGYRFRDGATA